MVENGQRALYRPELDVLRFVAFALVFISHGFAPYHVWMRQSVVPHLVWRPVLGFADGAGHGLDVFFLLSAYLITDILLREERVRGTISIAAFWARRVLRIWPLYFAFLAFAIWGAGYIVPNQSWTAVHAVAYATFWGNLANILFPGKLETVAGILWSVSIEEQFYLAWPVLIRFARRLLVPVIVMLIAISHLTRGYLLATGFDNPVVMWSNTLTRMEPIAVGSLIAVWLKGGTPRLGSPMRVAMLAAGLIVITIIGLFLDEASVEALIAFPLATIAAILLLFGLLGAPWTMPSTMVYLGRISYGLYVFHILSLQLTRTHLDLEPQLLAWAVQFTVAFGLTVALAAASYRWLEQPFLRLKVRYSRESPRLAA